MKSAIIAIALSLTSCSLFAQLDTTSFPLERQELRKLLSLQKPGTIIDCNDFIAVGPKGDISFSNQQWQEVQKKEKIIFKSVQTIPGNDYIRIYEGHIAVRNYLAEVKLVVDGLDVNLKVRRLEVYHKNASGWCRVAGQGTEVDEKMFPVKTD